MIDAFVRAIPHLSRTRCVLLVLSLAFSPSLVIAQRTQPAVARNSVKLQTSSEVVKRLAAVKDHVTAEQWSQAILILEQATADHGDSLVQVAPGRFWNVGTYCNAIIASFPAEGLAVYREKVDAQAKQWLDAGLADRNRALLEKVVHQAFASRAGDQALFWLGEWAWDRGDFAAARDYWRQLLKLTNPPKAGEPQTVLRYPDSSFAEPEILARIILCHLWEGDRELAELWLAYLQKTHPDAKGTLGGKTGELDEILKELFEQSAAWNQGQSTDVVLTFAGNPQRNGVAAKAVDVGGVQWYIPLPPQRFRPASLKPGKLATAPSHFPVVWKDTVFFCGTDQIYAVDLTTGDAKWRPPGLGKIDTPEELGLAAIYTVDRGSVTQNKHRLGVPRHTLTIQEDRLYARMGSPVTGQASNLLSSFDSRIVCLDLSKEGKLHWEKTPAQVLAGSETTTPRQWSFEGTPVVDHGRVYVGLRQSHPQSEAMLVCLDADSGQTRWIRRVASAISNIGEQQNYISHVLPTLGGNAVFYMPEFGVLTALDAETGRILWAVTYGSPPAKTSPVFNNPTKQGLTPVLFHRGVVYAAPMDSESIMAISAGTGVKLWQRTIPFSRDSVRHVLGVSNGRLYLSGNELWIFDANTGKLISPQQATPGRQPEFDGFGRGVIAGETIYWPSRIRLELRNLNGQRIKQPQPMAGGNLVIAKTFLLVAEPERLVAYTNVANVRKTIENAISQDPKAALPYYRLAKLEAQVGRTKRAAELFQLVDRLAKPDEKFEGELLKIIAAREQFQLWWNLGESARRTRSFTEALAAAQAALRVATSPQETAISLQLLGETQREMKNPKDSVRSFQKLLDDPGLRNLPVESQPEMTFGKLAEEQIQAQIDQYRREIYAEFDEIAGRLLQTAVDGNDANSSEVLQRFPNARQSASVRHGLATLARKQGDVHRAVALWQAMLETHEFSPVHEQALKNLAWTLDENGWDRAARKRWQDLAKNYPDTKITHASSPVNAAEFVAEHLQLPRFQNLDQTQSSLPWETAWQHSLPPQTQVVLPEGLPPAVDAEVFLIQSDTLSCHARNTGRKRWQKILNAPVIWSGYGQTHLLLGTQNTLLAVEESTGKTLWQMSANRADGKSIVRYSLLGNRVLVLQTDCVTAYSADSGERLWQTNSDERISSTWFVDEKFLVIQTEETPQIHVLDSLTGRLLSQHNLGSAWFSPPVLLPKRQTRSQELPGFVVALENRQVRAFSAFDPQGDPAWTYQQGLSFANRHPEFLSSSNHLVMLIDGNTLVRLNPRTGDVIWSKPLSPASILRLKDSAVLDGDDLYLAEEDTISCWRLDNGKRRWQRKLSGSTRSLLQKWGRYLLVCPQGSDAKASAMLLRADTGKPIQRLAIPKGLKRLDGNTKTPLLISDETLMAWGPLGFLSE